VRRAVLAVLAAVVVLSACSDDSIVLAKLPSADAQAPSIRCTVPGDCPSGTYCEKTTCGAAAGTCELFPALCPSVEEPVCGCDGITYLDDCLRKANGATGSRQGPCRLDDGTTCGGLQNVACPTGTVCGRLLGFGGPCDPSALGMCWMLPATCPTGPSPNRWDACGPGPQCASTCEAIKSGGAYRRAQCP
jgi:hypothetical protein